VFINKVLFLSPTRQRRNTAGMQKQS